MYNFQIVENTVVPLTEVAVEIIANPRPIVQKLDKQLLWGELEGSLDDYEICPIEKEFLQFSHGL